METVILTWEDGQATAVKVDTAGEPKVRFNGKTFARSTTKVDECFVYNMEPEAPPPPEDTSSSVGDFVDWDAFRVSTAEPALTAPHNHHNPAMAEDAAARIERTRVVPQSPLRQSEGDGAVMWNSIRQRIERSIDRGTCPVTGHDGNGCSCLACRSANLVGSIRRGRPIMNLPIGGIPTRYPSVVRLSQWFVDIGVPSPGAAEATFFLNPGMIISERPLQGGPYFNIPVAPDPHRLAGMRVSGPPMPTRLGRLMADHNVWQRREPPPATAFTGSNVILAEASDGMPHPEDEGPVSEF